MSERLMVDFDKTLTGGDESYFTEGIEKPDEAMVAWVNEQYRSGATVIIWTSRPWSVAGQTVARLTEWGVRFHGLLCEKGSADRYIDDKAYRPSEVLDQRDEHTDGQSVEEAVEESDFEASMVSAPVGGVSPLNIPTSPGARPTNCEVLSDPWLAFILGMASMGLVWAGSLII